LDKDGKDDGGFMSDTIDNGSMTGKKVIAYRGRLFKVVLESNFGSTNIGWCLTYLPRGIALLAEDVISTTSRPGAPVLQEFAFTVLDEKIENVMLEFRLIRHNATIGKDEQLEAVTIYVHTVEYKEGSIDKTNFVEYSENSATVPGHDSDCTRVLKYGYPPYMKYGYALAAGAAPCQSAAGSVETAIPPYGYPDPMIDYGYPSPVKYGYYGAGTGCAVVQDDCGCQVEKYGFPPLGKYGHPGSFVKYGYYGVGTGCAVVQDDCGRYIVKYGCLPASGGGAVPCPPVAGPEGVAIAYGHRYPGLKYGIIGCQS
jgi:hypothetical protein